MTTGVTPILTKLEDLFKTLIWDPLVKSAITSLFISVPWLSVWPLGAIVTYIITLFSDKLFDGTKLVIDIQAIILLNTAHKKEFDTEVVKLKIIAYNKGIDSDEFKKAREAAKLSLSKYIQFNK